MSVSSASHGRSECIFKQYDAALLYGIAVIQSCLVSNSSLRSFKDAGIIVDEGYKSF